MNDWTYKLFDERPGDVCFCRSLDDLAQQLESWVDVTYRVKVWVDLAFRSCLKKWINKSFCRFAGKVESVGLIIKVRVTGS